MGKVFVVTINFKFKISMITCIAIKKINQMSEKTNPNIDTISKKVSKFLITKLIKWFIRTTIGLIVFSIIWRFYNWGFWLFWSYVVIASISLIVIFYSTNILIKVVGNHLTSEENSDKK